MFGNANYICDFVFQKAQQRTGFQVNFEKKKFFNTALINPFVNIAVLKFFTKYLKCSIE